MSRATNGLSAAWQGADKGALVALFAMLLSTLLFTASLIAGNLIGILVFGLLTVAVGSTIGKRTRKRQKATRQARIERLQAIYGDDILYRAMARIMAEEMNNAGK